MNLWLRLIWLSHDRRGGGRRCALPDGMSVLRFRAWPTDLDPSLHVNNGRYLALMDLGRLDLMVGAGLWRHLAPPLDADRQQRADPISPRAAPVAALPARDAVF